MIHVVTVADLRRTAVTPAVVGDDAVALSEEEQHLRVPVIRTQGPTVMKNNGLGALRPPILVENLCPILGRSECHGLSSLFLGRKCSKFSMSRAAEPVPCEALAAVSSVGRRIVIGAT